MRLYARWNSAPKCGSVNPYFERILVAVSLAEPNQKKNYIEAIQSEHPEDNKKQQSVWKEQNQEDKKTRRDCLRVKAARGNFQLSIFIVQYDEKKKPEESLNEKPPRARWKLIEWTNEPTRDDSEIKIFQEKNHPSVLIVKSRLTNTINRSETGKRVFLFSAF